MAEYSSEPVMLHDPVSLTQSEDVPNERPKFNIIYVVGPPGAGRGTLCKLVAVAYDYCHLSVGDYLRDVCKNPTDHAIGAFAGEEPEVLATAMREAKLLAAAQIVSIVRHRLERLHAESGQSKFIIDGFPQTLESAQLFEKEVSGDSCRQKYVS